MEGVKITELQQPFNISYGYILICLSSSIFCNKLLILRFGKGSPLSLNIFHSPWSNC